MNARIARWIAWSLVGIYFVLAGSGSFWMISTNTTPADIPFPIILFVLVFIVVGIWPVIGARIVTHHPRHPVGWLLFATFPLVAIDVFTDRLRLLCHINGLRLAADPGGNAHLA